MAYRLLKEDAAVLLQENGNYILLDTTSYAEIYTDSVVVIDNIVKNELRILTDVATIVGTVNKNTSRLFSEVVTVVDTVANQAGKIFSETITIVDSILKSTGRTIGEIITIVESFIRNIGKTLTDTISVSDIIIKLFNYIGKLPSYIEARGWGSKAYRVLKEDNDRLLQENGGYILRDAMDIMSSILGGIFGKTDKPGIGVAHEIDKPERV